MPKVSLNPEMWMNINEDDPPEDKPIIAVAIFLDQLKTKAKYRVVRKKSGQGFIDTLTGQKVMVVAWTAIPRLPDWLVRMIVNDAFTGMGDLSGEEEE